MYVCLFLHQCFQLAGLHSGIFSCLLRDNHGIKEKNWFEKAAIWSNLYSIMKYWSRAIWIYQLTPFRDSSRQTTPRSIYLTFNITVLHLNPSSTAGIKIPREEFQIVFRRIFLAWKCHPRHDVVIFAILSGINHDNLVPRLSSASFCRCEKDPGCG